MTKTIKATKDSIANEYFQVNEKNEYFVYGRGWQKANNSKIEDIPKFNKYEGSIYELEDITTFINDNYNDYIEYTKKYGFEIILNQLNILHGDIATNQVYHFLLHSKEHKELVNYVVESIKIVKKIKAIATNICIQDSSMKFMEYRFNTASLTRYFGYDWLIHNWGFDIISRFDEQKSLIEQLVDTHTNSEISMKDFFNLHEQGLGDKINKFLDFRTYYEKYSKEKNIKQINKKMPQNKSL